MDPADIASFNKTQIKDILRKTVVIQNEAWGPSVRTGIDAMERGMMTKLFPLRAAMTVYQRATATRQAEAGDTPRWYIASLVESAALMRILTLKYPKIVQASEYRFVREMLIEHFRN
jgi:hypothetical protein